MSESITFNNLTAAWWGIQTGIMAALRADARWDVFLALSYFYPDPYPGPKKIAELTGLGETSIDAARLYLEKVGLIQRIGARPAKHYQIADISDPSVAAKILTSIAQTGQNPTGHNPTGRKVTGQKTTGTRSKSDRLTGRNLTGTRSESDPKHIYSSDPSITSTNNTGATAPDPVPSPTARAEVAQTPQDQVAAPQGDQPTQTALPPAGQKPEAPTKKPKNKKAKSPASGLAPEDRALVFSDYGAMQKWILAGREHIRSADISTVPKALNYLIPGLNNVTQWTADHFVGWTAAALVATIAHRTGSVYRPSLAMLSKAMRGAPDRPGLYDSYPPDTLLQLLRILILKWDTILSTCQGMADLPAHPHERLLLVPMFVAKAEAILTGTVSVSAAPTEYDD